MNPAHRWLSDSQLWRGIVQTHIVPWALENVTLAGRVLELGPGQGFTTSCLPPCELACLEIDPAYALRLPHRVPGGRIRVVAGDATAMPLSDESFDGIVCFTMLHHVSSGDLQDKLLGEAMRVLRPGGVFAGADTQSSAIFRLFHILENVAPVDPGAFPGRLRAAGFHDIQVDVRSRDFRFRARKPKKAFVTNG